MSALDQWYNQNPVWGAVNSWAERNKDNPTATAAANDLFVGAARSSIQRDSDEAYARKMISPMLDLQRGQQGIATEANLKDIAARGAVAQDIERVKGDTYRDVAGIETRSRERVSGMETGAQRYGYELALQGTQDTNRSAERRTETETQSAERRTGMETQSAERQIGLRGNEDRKTLTQGTDETLRLRADARGAIEGRGRKWFG